MDLKKVGFDEAMATGQLTVALDGIVLDTAKIGRLKVEDLERAQISFYGAQLRLDRVDYQKRLRWSNSTEERQQIMSNPVGIGTYWARGGVSSSPVLPRAPFLPQSNALRFLQEEYASQMRGVNDKVQIMLD